MLQMQLNGDFMKEYINTLKNSKLFEGINESEIENILSSLSAEKKSFKKGEYVFRAGKRIEMFGLLLEGSVHIQQEDYWGNLSILNKVSRGEIFGEAYAVQGSGALLNNVVAVESSIILFLDINNVISGQSLKSNLYSVLLKNLFSMLAEKNRILAQKLEHMSKRTIREKLLSYLSEQSIRQETSDFDIPFNRGQLADFLSVDRSAMSRELCRMKEEGLIEFNKNHFVLKQQI